MFTLKIYFDNPDTLLNDWVEKQSKSKIIVTHDFTLGNFW